MNPSRWLVIGVWVMLGVIVVQEFGPAGIVVAAVCVGLILFAVVAANRTRDDGDDW